MEDEGFARIDKALSIYYKNQGRDDYYDVKGDGKFLLFVVKNEFDEKRIDLELGDDANPNDCLYITMDDDFPLNSQNDEDSRAQQIFNIIKHCYKPPISFDFSADTMKCDGTLCEHKTRLLYALGYYQKLNVSNANDQNKLIRFYKETYRELLNDFIHVISNHNDDLDEIYDYVMADKALSFEKCDVLKCKWAQRHNRDRTKTDVDIEKTRGFDETLKQTVSEDEKIDPNEWLKRELLRDCPQFKSQRADETGAVKEDDDGSFEDSNDSEDSDNWHTYEPEDVYKYTISIEDHECHKIADEVYYDVECDIDINIDLEFLFIRDLFDAVHCYILHQYDFGYRIHRKEKQMHGNPTESKDGNDDEDEYYDNAFAVITEIIKKKKNILSHIPRFAKSDKFTIKQTVNASIITAKDVTLFMDKMYEEIQLHDEIESNALIHTKTFLEKEEYDTDGMEMDLSVLSNENKSILKKSLDDKVFKIINLYLPEYEVSRRSFSTGLILYYWDYYRDQTEIHDEAKDRFNVNDHGGYKPQELFVERKYPDIKHEILNNEIFTLDITLFNIALTKAYKFMATPKTRQMKTSAFTKDVLHYGLRVGIIPKVSHLLSAILYTDWGDLCTAFSKTFRKEYIYEQLDSVIRRNQEFANWSRLLREVVEGFGTHCFELRDRFYCGMTGYMVMPEMNIRLCGPTSTAAHIEVAATFAGSGGIIIQLNNYSAHDTNTPSELRGFPCAWLGHYTGEDEYLFMGGHSKIGIESIKHLSSLKENIKTKYFKALFLFDCMINGTRLINTNIKRRHVVILETLVEKALDEDRFVKDYPKYINNTFQKLVDSKQTLILNSYETNQWMKDLEHILFYGLCMESEYSDDGKPHKAGDNVNLIKPLIFKLFKNINKIVIYSNTWRSRTWKHYPFKLKSLLSILLTPELDIANGFTINIKTAWHRHYSDIKRLIIPVGYVMNLHLKYNGCIIMKIGLCNFHKIYIRLEIEN